MLRLVLIILFTVSLCVTSKDGIPSVSVTRPANGDVYVIRNGTSTSVSLAFDHKFANEEDTNGAAFCFHIFKTNSNVKYSESCFKMSTRDIIINEVGPGEYILTTFLREFNEELQAAASIIPETTSTTSFKVVNEQIFVPLLSIQSDSCSAGSGPMNSLSFATNANTNTAVAEVAFTLHYAAQSISTEAFSICLTLLGPDDTALVEESCLHPDQHSAVLSNLPVGTYTLRAGLKGPNNEDVIQSSVITASVHVYDLQDAVQSISIAGAVGTGSSPLQLEYVIDTKAGKTADAPISVTIQTEPCTAEKLVGLCLELHASDKHFTTSGAIEPGNLLSRQCFPPEVRTLTPRHLVSGVYTAVITLHDARDMPSTGDSSAPSLPLRLPPSTEGSKALRVLLETRAMEELVPSYDWQRLHAWHTIPAGMDVRLPIGGAGHKEARIPQPWRLQALLPKGCKGGSFLRMDLHRHSTIGDIRKRAESLCRNMAGVYTLYDSNTGELMGPDPATVEETKLFQRKVHVEYEQA